MKPDGVDKVDKVENKISKERDDDQRFPSIRVRDWSSKHCEYDPWDTLQHRTV